MYVKGMRPPAGLLPICKRDTVIFQVDTLNFKRTVEVQSFSEACFLFPNFLYYARTLCAICVTHLYKINFLTWKMQMVPSINQQGTVSRNDYTVQFSMAIQSGDV